MNNFLRRMLGLLLGLAFVGGSVQAQQTRQMRQDRLSQLENAKIAYLTDRLTLTQDQAQQFWPVYNEFVAKRRELNQRLRRLRNDNVEGLTDSQLRDNLTQALAVRQSEVDLEKDYFNKFQKVISIQQVAKLYVAEREFTKVLIRKLDARRDGPPAGEASN